jgi:hypothetical protein
VAVFRASEIRDQHEVAGLDPLVRIERREDFAADTECSAIPGVQLAPGDR